MQGFFDQKEEDNDLGFDLLMNPRKKQSSDSISVSSKGSLYGRQKVMRDVDNMSVKSVEVDVKPQLHVDEESELSYEVTTDNESVVKRPQRGRATQARSVDSSTEESGSDYSVEVGERRMSDEEILQAKQEYLYQFDRLEKKGIRLPRKFTLASSLEEMKVEYERLKRDKEVDASVKFQRRMLMAFASGVEFLNERFDPFDVKLSGWSEKIHEDIEDYDEVFEELHEKYKGKAKIAPEMKLIFMMGSSAFMFHLTNSMFKNSLPGLDQVLKQNPELMKQFAAATANTMAQQQKQTSGPFGGLASMFGSMFGGGGAGGNTTNKSPRSEDSMSERSFQQQKPQMRGSRMKGPSNVDDILKELNVDDANDRIEMMSTVTESELFDIQDDGSINGLLMATKKKGKKGKNTVSLDL